MSVASVELPEFSRTANRNDLFSINHVHMSLKGCESLSFLGRAWLAYIVALVRTGYTEIKAPMWAIQKAQWLAVGYSNSKSSAYRGLAELENAGFISRPSFRVGSDNKISVIHFSLDRFVYWTKVVNNNVIPLPTKSHKGAHVSSCEGYDCTSNPPKLDSFVPVSLSLDSSKSKKRARKNGTGRYETNPVLWSIGHVLREDKEPRIKRIYVTARAIFDGKIKSDAIDLAVWTPARWWSMTHDEREYIARVELIPALKGAKKMPKTSKPFESLVSGVIGSFNRPAELDDEVYQFVTRQKIKPVPAEIESTLDPEDMKILEAAKKRAEQAMKNAKT